jgi:putative DNA primase/helicase
VTKDYRETSDMLQGFLPGVLVADPTAELLGADAYRRYRDWCEDEGLRLQDVWQRKTFYGAMDERGVPRVKREKGVVLQGVRLATPADVAAEAEPRRGAADLDDHLGGAQ